MRYITKTQIQSSSPTLKLRAKTTAGELSHAIKFTRFDTALNMSYDEQASIALKKDHWRVLDSFKFYYTDPKECDYGDSDDLKWAVVPAGFLTDGASVPRLLWGFIAPWGSYGQAAALHDYLLEYGVVFQSNQRTNISRKEADLVFNEALRVANVPKWKRRLMYHCVRLFSKTRIRPSVKFLYTKRELEASWVKAQFYNQ